LILTAFAQDYSLRDPVLSEPGFSQCEDLHRSLQNDLPEANEVELIVVSPMRRTLQTAQAGLRWLIERGVPVQLRGEWQENSDKPCDKGTYVGVISKEFPNFDFSTVFPDWPAKSGRWAFTDEAIVARGKACREWLQSRPEKVIAVVSPVCFLILHTQGVAHRS